MADPKSAAPAPAATPTSAENKSEAMKLPVAFATLIQLGLFGVAAVSVLCALLHALFPTRFDETTAMFLALAAVALIIHQITEFSGFGITVKKAVEQLQEDLKGVEQAVGGLEKDLGPGSKSAEALTPSPPTIPETATGDTVVGRAAASARFHSDDPNKGQFGGSPEANGRRLTALIRPSAGPKSSRCKVRIRVESTDPARPLTGSVTLFLHPTFGEWASYDLDVAGGVAEDEITSYGAFTIGAVADDGATRLELDLSEVDGGSERFYEE
jgi:hypothetical protein